MSALAWAGLGDQPIQSELHPHVRYRLERPLGEGGMAIAFYAMREAPEGATPAVLKVVRPDIVATAGPTARLMVRKEAIALGRLNERVPPTPFVIRFLDTGVVTLGGLRPVELPWLAIEYVHGGVEGTTLEQRVAYSVENTGLAFDSQRAAHAIECLAEGLTAIHDVDVVHRDLTPGNVLCCGFGASEVFKIADFGIARPQGVSGTFGNVALGTPGYSAPEQIFSGQDEVGPWTDVFSVSCLVYFLLTGEKYFDTENMARAFLQIRESERRSLLDAKALSPEIRENRAVVRTLDHALSRATSLSTRERPQSADQFAANILPALRQASPRSLRASERLVRSVVNDSKRTTLGGWTWTIRHPPGDDRLLRSVAWDGDAHCLAVTTNGLAFWNGTDWCRANHDGIDDPLGLRFAGSTRPGRWILTGEHGLVALYGSEGVVATLDGPRDVTFSLLSGDIDDLALVVGQSEPGPPMLYSIAARRTFKPVRLDAAALVTAIARVGDTRWFVIGRNRYGGGFAALHDALTFETTFLPLPATDALIACAGQIERGLGIAAGRQGVTLRVAANEATPRIVPDRPDLASAAIDVHGRVWVGSAGRLWTMSAEPNAAWAPAWRDASWTLPLVALRADVGMVTAVAVDGAILEGRMGA